MKLMEILRRKQQEVNNWKYIKNTRMLKKRNVNNQAIFPVYISNAHQFYTRNTETVQQFKQQSTY